MGIIMTYDERNHNVLRSMNPDEMQNMCYDQNFSPKFNIHSDCKKTSPIRILSRSSSGYIPSHLPTTRQSTAVQFNDHLPKKRASHKRTSSIPNVVNTSRQSVSKLFTNNPKNPSFHALKKPKASAKYVEDSSQENEIKDAKRKQSKTVIKSIEVKETPVRKSMMWQS